MKPIAARVFALIAVFGLVTVSMVGHAAVVQNKPFAVAKVALQISDPNPFKQTLVLNVAGNLLKHYGPDRVAVEIVAFGPGLRLLFKGNSNTSRIDSLVSDGVRFSACKNTIRAMTRKMGHAPILNVHAIPVSAGVVRLIQLQKAGYTIIKP